MICDYSVKDFISVSFVHGKRFRIPISFSKDPEAGGLLVFSIDQQQLKEFFFKKAKKKGIKILYESPPARNTSFGHRNSANTLVIFEKM